MKSEKMTHTGTVSKQVDFEKKAEFERDFRETKHHFIDKYGTKFSKKTGQSLAGWKYKGVFIGEKLDLSTITPKKETLF